MRPIALRDGEGRQDIYRAMRLEWLAQAAFCFYRELLAFAFSIWLSPFSYQPQYIIPVFFCSTCCGALSALASPSPTLRLGSFFPRSTNRILEFRFLFTYNVHSLLP